ncbi:MAG: YihA family ribosome biogenesis GTP-binding protein [Ruminococcaceae bacterium]|nr:YihA family ribosome biogenesis GTP-binding protein [Oscillospiraceae bacterium]
MAPINLQNAKLHISAGDPRQFPGLPVPQIALSGRSNVGKSSLVNTLLGRKALARVSSAPGKTITVNFYDVDGKLFLVDLPGYGFAKRPPQEKAKWSALTDGYFTKNQNIDRVALVLQLIDLKVGPTADDVMMLRYLAETGLPFAVVATKTDKLNKTGRTAALEALAAHPDIPDGTPILPFSAQTGEGKEEVWRLLRQAAEV